MKFIKALLLIVLLSLSTSLLQSKSTYAFAFKLIPDKENYILVGEKTYIKTGPLNKNIKRVTCEISGKAISFLGKSGNHPSGYTFTFKGAAPGKAIITEKIFKFGEGGETVESKRFIVKVYSSDKVPPATLKQIAENPQRYFNRLIKLLVISRGWGKPIHAKEVWGTMVTRSDWIVEDNSGAAYITGSQRVEKGKKVSIICRVLPLPKGSWILLEVKRLMEIRQDIVRLITENNNFALDLYKMLAAKNQNVFFSPISISCALAMTYAGARGDTEKQMASVLHFQLPQSKLHTAFASLIHIIQSVSSQKSYELYIANALWGQKGYKLLESFKKIIKDNYNGGFYTVDFARQTEEAREKINQWIEEKTNKKIKNLIARGDLSPLVRLVLTNAIYFKSKWASPFKKDNTKELPFHITNHKSIKVPMMYQEANFPYFEDNSLKILELPYEGNKISMLILLPKKNSSITQIEKKLTIARLRTYFSRLKRRDVSVYIPKFKLNKKYYLKHILSAMGMPIAFSKQADFSGITGDKELEISKIIHQAFVDVNEEGTEAAAATAVVLRLKAIMLHPIFKADHPFIFMIVHKDTGSILFMGKVINPKA